MPISSEQVRAARALLRLEQKDLAERSGVSLPTIKRLETRPGPLAAHAPTEQAIRRALEDAGVEFTNGSQPGVRLKIYVNANESAVVVPAPGSKPIEFLTAGEAIRYCLALAPEAKAVATIRTRSGRIITSDELDHLYRDRPA